MLLSGTAVHANSAHANYPGTNAEEEGCVLSLKDENDRYYALFGKNLDSKLQENTSVVVWGNFKNGSYADYDVVGFIEVTKVEKQ